jgi:hypothetical protein
MARGAYYMGGETQSFALRQPAWRFIQSSLRVHLWSIEVAVDLSQTGCGWAMHLSSP